MSAAATAIWTPEAVRELDRTAIREFGIPGYELMKRAATAAFEAGTARWPGVRRWLVLCGSGNNAGDGYLVARLARLAGLDVRVCALSDPERLTGDAATACRDFVAAGGTPEPFSAEALKWADLVVDAMLGTGLSRDVEGTVLGAIEAVNGSGRAVLALDIPSGLNATTGLPAGNAIRAGMTVTFVGRKLGLHLGEGPAFAGTVVFADLGIPAEAIDRAGLAGTAPLRLFGEDQLRTLLPPRRATAHKGSFGHVLVVGGNHGMSGAVRLAGEGALRAGAGLVSVATRPAHAAHIPLVRPELMCHGVGSATELAPLLARATVVATGPGLGQDDWARELLDAVLGT